MIERIPTLRDPNCIAVSDAIQIGLAAVQVGQAAAAAGQGSFTLAYAQAQRLLAPEARGAMPGRRRRADGTRRPCCGWGSTSPRVSPEPRVVIEWEGNAFGEIGTPVIRRDLATSTERTHFSATITIIRIDRIPLPGSDPRAWPIVYSYEGTYDPAGNGYFEFSGEFEVNAFGGLKFNRHEVLSRSALDVFIGGMSTSTCKMAKRYAPHTRNPTGAAGLSACASTRLTVRWTGRIGVATSAGCRAGPWQDPASTDLGRTPQRVRGGSLNPLVRRYGRVLAPDRSAATAPQSSDAVTDGERGDAGMGGLTPGTTSACCCVEASISRHNTPGCTRARRGHFSVIGAPTPSI